jgi:hypothetical protein
MNATIITTDLSFQDMDDMERLFGDCRDHAVNRAVDQYVGFGARTGDPITIYNVSDLAAIEQFAAARGWQVQAG